MNPGTVTLILPYHIEPTSRSPHITQSDTFPIDPQALRREHLTSILCSGASPLHRFYIYTDEFLDASVQTTAVRQAFERAEM